MSFWSNGDRGNWSIPANQEVVQPYDPGALEDANYLLSIGDEVYVSSPEVKSKIQKLTDEKPNFSIDPGQFAFLLTAERVTIPFNAIGFISIRASIKFMGLVNISGFHVDPGYSGKIIFAVFNAGPTRIHLQKGQRAFPLWLAALDDLIKRKDIKPGYDGIPPSLVTQISGNFTTAYQVKTQLDEIKEDVARLKAFKYYLTAIIAALGIILFPVIKDRLSDIFSVKPPATSSKLETLQSPAVIKPQASPNKSSN